MNWSTFSHLLRTFQKNVILRRFQDVSDEMIDMKVCKALRYRTLSEEPPSRLDKPRTKPTLARNSLCNFVLLSHRVPTARSLLPPRQKLIIADLTHEEPNHSLRTPQEHFALQARTNAAFIAQFYLSGQRADLLRTDHGAFFWVLFTH